MDPLSVAPMVMPSASTTIAFVIVVLFVAATFVAGVWWSGRRRGDGRRHIRRDTSIAIVAVLGYLALTWVVSGSGILRSPALPPRAMFFFLGCNVVGLVLALSPLGRRFADHLPLAGLVGIQVFRLPLELILHRWHIEGVLPVQMTYAGYNFDILSGIFGGLLGVALIRRRIGCGPVWVYNVVGLALLVVVASIAVLSSPVPFRRFVAEPAAQLPFYAPYGWIVPFCVGGALFFHVVTFRWLIRRRTI